METECLNEQNRFHATRVDIEKAIARVPEVLAGDFKDLWEGRDSSDLMQSILKDIAKTKFFPKNKLKRYQFDSNIQKTLNFIMRRDILMFKNDTYYFGAGLLHLWVENKASANHYR